MLPTAIKFTDTDTEWWLPEGVQGAGNGESVFNTYRVSFVDDEKVLEMDDGMVIQLCECI